MTFTDGDVELTQKLIEIFLEDSPQLLSVICEAIERNDAAALERAAHTMKGALGYFGAGAAMDSALRLQQLGAKKDLTAAPEIMKELESALEQLTNLLSEFGKAYV
jgi:two-component system, sensor histidine kinase and response regulator